MDIHVRKPERRRAAAALFVVFAGACMAFALWAGLHAWRGDRTGNVNDRHGNVTVAGNSAETGNGDERDSLSGRRVYFAGFEDSVFGKKTKLELKNPQENRDFYMKYCITDTVAGEILYESDLIESGRALYWRPADALTAGTWHLSIQMMPYYSPDHGETWTPLTSTDNRVDFTILQSTAGESDDNAAETAGAQQN